jgi:glycerol-3-phosphate dehydrogenase
MTSVQYDVVVIGAGIHGAGVAQAAAAAGYSVLVLEQYNEAAKGSSSRSSKLIHGGLRYLESGEFHLVRECLRERARLLRNAPHLVKLVPFYIPVYQNTRRRPWKIALGLMMYSLFSRKRFHRISSHDWNQLDGLRNDQLDAVFSYYDAQTDDARLTRSVLQSARTLGAEVITGAEFSQAMLDSGEVSVSYQKDGQPATVTARVLVNAAGSWVNHVLQRVQQPSGAAMVLYDMDLVQGTHIVIPGQITHPYYLEAPQDGRAVFVVPWKNNIMVGTTELEYGGNPADVRPTAAEIDYLLEIYNHYFKRELGSRDVIEAFAGLRVLPAGGGNASSKSRETHFHENDPDRPRVVSIYGGKLTSYRATAEKLLRRIKTVLPETTPVADTRSLEIPVVD